MLREREESKSLLCGLFTHQLQQNIQLDANVDPGSDIVSRTVDDARAKQQRLDYFIASCEFGNGQCGGDRDMRTW